MTGSRMEPARWGWEMTAAVSMMGAVSPAARPMDRMEPVTIPPMAAGMTTL